MWFSVTYWLAAALLLLPCRLPEILRHVPMVLVSLVALRYALRRGFRLRLLTAPILFLVALWVYACPTSLFYRLTGGEASLFSGVALLILPISLIFTPDSILPAKPEEVLRKLELLGVVFLIGSGGLLTLSYAYPSSVWTAVHVRSFCLFLPAIAAYAQKKHGRGLLWGGIAAVIMMTDPRSTEFLVLVFVVGMSVALRFKRYAVVTPLLGVTVTLLLGDVSEMVLDAARGYKASLGGQDNMLFRADMIARGLEQVASAPILGKAFMADTAYWSAHNRAYLPLHNDYLELLVAGGILALGLFVAPVLLTWLMSLGNACTIRQGQGAGWTNVSAVLGLTLGAACITMMFNPVLNEPVTAYPFWWFYSLTVLVNQRCKDRAVIIP